MDWIKEGSGDYLRAAAADYLRATKPMLENFGIYSDFDLDINFSTIYMVNKIL